MKDLLNWLSSVFPDDATKAAFAGALGGLVRWLTLRENPRDGIAALVVGCICAIYLGPLVAPILEPTFGRIAPDNDPSGFAGFVIGLGGISISGLVIGTIRNRQRLSEKEGAE